MTRSIHTVTVVRQDMDPRLPGKVSLKSSLELSGDFREEERQQTFGNAVLHALNAGVSRAAKDGSVTVVEINFGEMTKAESFTLRRIVSRDVLESLRFHAEHLGYWEKISLRPSSQHEHFRISAALKGVK